METITLSSKGQIVIPKKVRQSAHLSFGDELSISYSAGEIRLRPLMIHTHAQIDQVAGILARPGRKMMSDAEVKLNIKQRLNAKNAV